MERPIYLDDLRVPRESPPYGFWVVLRSFEAAQTYVEEHGCPSFISFDHDLGAVDDGQGDLILLPTGYDFVKWLCEKDLDNPGFIPSDFSYRVHSANPVGKRNITSYLDGYLKQR